MRDVARAMSEQRRARGHRSEVESSRRERSAQSKDPYGKNGLDLVGILHSARKLRGTRRNCAAPGVPRLPCLRSPANADAGLRMTARRFRAWLGFARLTALIYTSHSLSKRLSSSGAAIFHAQAHIPAQPSSPLEDARISYADEDQGRPRGDFAKARQGPQAGVGEARLP